MLDVSLCRINNYFKGFKMSILNMSVVVPLGEKRDSGVIESLDKQDKKVAVFIEWGTNPSANRNRGIKKAKTEIVAFVDGHSRLPKNWSKKVCDFFNKYENISIVGGPQITPKNSTYFERSSGYALSSIFGAAGSSARYGGGKLILDADETKLTSANMACRKEVFQKVKFDENIYPGEDPKFVSDSKKNNFNVAYNPEMISYHKRRPNFLGFMKQIFNYGSARPKKESFLETLKHPSFLVPSAFFLYLLILYPLILLNVLFIIPFFLYSGINILFSAYESVKRRKIISIFLLPFLFLGIHLSYGSGFIFGAFKEWIL